MIKKAVIHNYRSCLQTEVELHPELTVLIGANGVGKSNILQAFDLISKIENTRKIAPELVDSLDGYSRSNVILQIETDRENRYTIDFSMIYLEEETTNTETLKLVDIKYAKDIQEYRFLDFDIFEFSSFTHLLNNEKFYGTDNDKRKKEIPIVSSFRNISYYSAGQFTSARNCPASIEISRYNLPAYEHSGKPYTKYIRDLYQCFINRKNIFSQYLHIIGEESFNLVEDIRFDTKDLPNKNSISEIEDNAQLPERQIVTLSFRVNGSYLFPSQLSDGTFRTLALIFYLLSDESDLLLIEEPEISVHHGLLSSIVELIKQESKRKQIVISTHSELVLDAVQPENVLMITKDTEKGTLAERLTKKLSKNEFKALEEYLETQGNLGEYWLETGLEYEV